MTSSEVEEELKRGSIGMLPHYQGYFKWDYGNDCMYMLNGNYVKYDLDEERLRTDFYIII